MSLEDQPLHQQGSINQDSFDQATHPVEDLESSLASAGVIASERGADPSQDLDYPEGLPLAKGEHRATLLVVDDEAAVRRVLVMRLHLAGYRVICAEDGEAALALFHQEQPDLVVLDVMLPKLDGFAVCRRLRAESCVPIIFLSALDAITERVAGLDLGADDYLPKPFSPKELEARIATILRRVGRGSAAAEPREVTAGCARAGADR